MTEHSDFLNGATEIGAYLNVSPRTVYHLAERRQLPIFRRGGKLVARKSTLSRDAEERERAACSPEPETAGAARA